MFRNGSGTMFPFGFRVVEIIETFETYLELCLSNRIYAWTDLESIWCGRGACVLTFAATYKCQIFPWFMD